MASNSSFNTESFLGLPSFYLMTLEQNDRFPIQFILYIMGPSLLQPRSLQIAENALLQPEVPEVS